MTKPSITEQFAACEDAIKRINSIEIRHPAMTNALKELEFSRCMSSYGGASSPHNIFIEGPSGMGKTTICERYLKLNPPDLSVFPHRVPVLFASIPKCPAPSSIPLALLRAMGDRFIADRARNNTRLLYQTIQLIDDLGVEQILLDEFQHLIDQNRKVVLKDQADVIKTLVNEVKKPFALIGLPEATAITDLNEQARRRFSNRISLAPFDWRVPHQRKTFRKFLSLVEAELPFEEPSGLDHEDVAFKLYQSGSGLIGYTMDIIRAAATLAVLEGARRISLDHFSQAYERKVRGLNGKLPNPFAEDEAFDYDGIVEPGSLNAVLSTSEIKLMKKAA